MTLVQIKKKIETFEQREERKNKYLEQEELKKVLKDMEIIDKGTARIIEFLSLTGLRFGECVGLQVKNIQGDTIQINGSWDEVSRTKTTTKNIYSDRKISLSKRASQILKTQVEQNIINNINFGLDDDYIFTGKTGTPKQIFRINYQLKKIKIGKTLSTHIFRHTHIALLTELGIPLKAIMERVGHNNPQTTLSIYSHVTDKMSKNIIEKLNEIDLLN